jgi:hypothetical protein
MYGEAKSAEIDAGQRTCGRLEIDRPPPPHIR